MADEESNQSKSCEFMSGERWDECRKEGKFDCVVIGSSFCAWAFTQRMLLKNKEAKILILERGERLPADFENLTSSEKWDQTYETKTCPWNITQKMLDGNYIKELDGMNSFFGGQSAFWRGWCPKPTREDLEGWPESVKDVIEEYFPIAAELLNVIPANEIGEDHHRVFGELHNVLMARIKSCLPETVKRVDHASLAVRAGEKRCERIQKTSVAEPLLELLREEKLEIKIGCEVKIIVHENGKAVSLETNEGDFKLGNAKLILALGVLPPTTLMLKSFPSLTGIGSRFTAHFRSSILARVVIHDNLDPSSMYYSLRKKISGRFEVAAMHIPGLNADPKRQFHIQLSAILDDTPREDPQTAERQYPEVIPAVFIKKRSSSEGPPHILLVCKIIGGLDHCNENNWFRLDNEVSSMRDDHAGVSWDTTLQAVTSEMDLQLWDAMEESTFSVIEKLRDYSEDPCQLEYWHGDDDGCRKDRPPREKIRRDRLVHPASTMWIGDDESSPVDPDYRFRGVENVYLTGGALWPVAGSLNPTCIMVALAMNLADKLRKH